MDLELDQIQLSIYINSHEQQILHHIMILNVKYEIPPATHLLHIPCTSHLQHDNLPIQTPKSIPISILPPWESPYHLQLQGAIHN